MHSAPHPTQRPLSTGPAGEVDIPKVLLLCELWLHESGCYDAALDGEKVRRLLGWLIQGGGHVVVAKDGDLAVGFVCGVIVERWFSSERVAQTFAAYVFPEYRDSKAMDLLIWEFQAWAVMERAGMVETALMLGASAESYRASVGLAGFFPIAGYFGWRPGTQAAQVGDSVPH